MMIVASLSGCLGSGGTMHEGATDTIDSWDGACDESCAECDSGSELDCTVCPNGTSMVDVDNDGAGECISDDSNGTNNSTNIVCNKSTCMIFILPINSKYSKVIYISWYIFNIFCNYIF